MFAHPTLFDLLEGITSIANEQRRHHDFVHLRIGGRRGVRLHADHAWTAGRWRHHCGSGVDRHHAVQLARAGYPIVVVGRAPAMSTLTTVGVDDFAGAQLATRHMIEVHNAKRIAHVSGPLRHQSAADKRDGYVAALKEAGLSLDPRLQYEGDYSEASGVAAAAALLPFVHNSTPCSSPTIRWPSVPCRLSATPGLRFRATLQWSGTTTTR